VHHGGRRESPPRRGRLQPIAALADVDLAGVDAPLIDAAKRAELGVTALSAFGRDWGSAEGLDLA
jgi:hypothetical protein